MTFSSLDVHLHTEALLNAMNFLNNLLPPPAKKEEGEGGQEELPTILEEDETEKEEEKTMETVVTKKKSWFSFQMLQSSYCFCTTNSLFFNGHFFLQHQRLQSLQMW